MQDLSIFYLLIQCFIKLHKLTSTLLFVARQTNMNNFIFKVNWRPVLGGFCLQFYFAVIILRWNAGYQALQWVGQRVSQFLAFTDEGSRFVFGDNFTDHFFAMKVIDD